MVPDTNETHTIGSFELDLQPVIVLAPNLSIEINETHSTGSFENDIPLIKKLAPNVSIEITKRIFETDVLMIRPPPEFLEDELELGATGVSNTLFYIFGVLGTLVCVFGIICNIVNLFVFRKRKSNQKSCTVLFTVLSVFDLANLMSFLLFGSVQIIIYRIDEGREATNIAAELNIADYVDGLSNIFVTGSVFTTVALTIDRYVAVSRPFQWPFLCSKRRSWIIIFILTIGAVILNIPLLLERSSITSGADHETPEEAGNLSTAVNYDSVSSTDTYPYYDVSLYVLVEQIHNVDSYFHNTIYLKVILPVFMLFIPAIVIFFCTCGIVLHVRQNKVGVASDDGNGQSKAKAAKRTSRVTIQVIIMAIATLIANGMRAFSFVVMAMNDTVYLEECSQFCKIFVSLSNVILVSLLNSGINMILFCCYSQSFRDDAKAILLCRVCSSGQNAASSHGSK